MLLLMPMCDPVQNERILRKIVFPGIIALKPISVRIVSCASTKPYGQTQEMVRVRFDL